MINADVCRLMLHRLLHADNDNKLGLTTVLMALNMMTNAMPLLDDSTTAANDSILPPSLFLISEKSCSATKWPAQVGRWTKNYYYYYYYLFTVN